MDSDSIDILSPFNNIFGLHRGDIFRLSVTLGSFLATTMDLEFILNYSDHILVHSNAILRHFRDVPITELSLFPVTLLRHFRSLLGYSWIALVSFWIVV